MIDTVQKDKDPVVYSSRRKRSLNRTRLMDVDKSANPDQLPPDTPIAIYSLIRASPVKNRCMDIPSKPRSMRVWLLQLNENGRL